MFFLADFNVIKPDFGLLFWTSVIFLLFFLLMWKFAFGPIGDALEKRESDIRDALDEAKKARNEMEQMNSENERLMAEARTERAAMLKEAKETRDRLVNEAKQEAKQEANKIVTNAKREIEAEKQAAMVELKNQVGNMAIDIAEKVLRNNLKTDAAQQNLVNDLVKDMKLN